MEVLVVRDREMCSLKRLFLLCLLLLAFLSVKEDEGAAAACRQEEREALLELQRASSSNNQKLQLQYFDGLLINKSDDAWIKWDEEEDCCEWQGVHCDQVSGRVVELRLPTCTQAFSKYEGGLPAHCYHVCSPLPSSLSRLESLQVLDLRGGCFSGAILPHIFSSFTNLTHLDLSFNAFESLQLADFTLQIPKLAYLNFSHLEFLDPAHSSLNLSSLATSLPNLKYLDLSQDVYSFETPWVFNASIIPAEFSGSFLPQLVHLDLSYLGLGGLIPEEIGTLQSLAYLDLAGNNFKNPLPWQGLANLCALKHLALGNPADYATEVLVWNSSHPHWQCNWKALESLSCQNMQFASNISAHPLCLEGPRSVISKLNYLSFTDHVGSIGPLLHSLSLPTNASLSLKTLSLRNTSLWEFQAQHNPPAWLSSINTPFLEVLDVSHNGLTSNIPPWIPHRLPSLKSLDVSSNQLNGSLHHLYQYMLLNSTQLESLHLSRNAFTGTIPLSLLMPSLSYLGLSNNLLSGAIPPSIGNLSKFSLLSLSDNSLTGAIPPSLGKLSHLRYLDLYDNSLTGAIPPSIGNVSQLSYLGLSDNSLTGAIPPSIGNMSQLSFLLLSDNRLTGSIPLQKCASLQYLQLFNNNLSGGLSHVFQNCINLYGVYLSNNTFSGTLSHSFNKCDVLSYMDLSINNLSGALPEEIGNCSNLRMINIGKNSLTLEIPASVGKLGRLMFFQLDRNKLNGGIPTGLQNCSSLAALDLSYNQLSGRIPEWITGHMFPRLEALMLSNNHFQGSIPLSLIQNLTRLRILVLASNNLTGTIPSNLDHLEGMKGGQSSILDEIGELTIPTKSLELPMVGSILNQMTTLDLSHNLLQGSIPLQIGALKALHCLNLSHNTLDGLIPSSLGQLLDVLESLDLSDNRLTGSIPLELCSLHFLGDLDLSQNRLEGAIPSCTQFSTFNETSFAKNEGLCGSPLPNQCQPAPPTSQEEMLPRDHLGFLGQMRKIMDLRGFGIGYALGALLVSLFLYYRAYILRLASVFSNRVCNV